MPPRSYYFCLSNPKRVGQLSDIPLIKTKKRAIAHLTVRLDN